MGRSKGAAARRRKAAAAARRANAPRTLADGPRECPSLPPELLADIHDRLRFLDRIAFAAAFSASCDDDDLFRPYAPWLLLPGKTAETVELFSVADRRAATARAPCPALRGHSVLGSSRGWLATADDRGQIYLANPATGRQHALPHTATMGVFLHRTHYHSFSVWIKPFLTVRFGGGPPFPDNRWGPEGYGTSTFPADRMRMLFYRKVVLAAASPRRPGTAMLILDRDFGAPAFATAEDAAWKLAPSNNGVEDAIHHDGQFYSVSYSGIIETWQRDAESGAYTSTAVTPRLTIDDDEEEKGSPRKYLAAAPCGRLMVVLKYATKERYSCDSWTYSFKVHAHGDDRYRFNVLA